MRFYLKILNSKGDQIDIIYKFRIEINPKLKYGKRIKKTWWNTNNLLKKGWEGVTTGQTLPAGNCLSSLKDDVFIVVLNCSTM